MPSASESTVHQQQQQRQPFKKIIIGCDHGAFDMKQHVVDHLKSDQTLFRGEIFDFGIHSPESVDYPDIAKEVCQKIQSGEYGTCVYDVCVCINGC